MATICLLQDKENDWNKILGFILSLDLYKDNVSNCVIFSNQETMDMIEKFPKKFDFNIEFNIIDTNIINKNLYIRNFITAMSYTIEKYGEALFINKNLIMINDFTVSQEIKDLNIGFIKKTFDCPLVTDHQKYSLDLLYINNMQIMSDIISHFEEVLDITDLMEYDVSALDEGEFAELSKRALTFYLKLSIALIEKYEIDVFLNSYICIGSEDFFAYENCIKLADINKNFEVKCGSEELDCVPVSFIHLRPLITHPSIQELTKIFMKLLATKNIAYMSILNIVLSKKISFLLPRRGGVGIWNREKDVGGMFELCELISETNEFAGMSNAIGDYFAIGNYIITDKPSHFWLNNTISQYSGILIANYDESLLELLDDIPKRSHFLCYYASFPRKYEEFVRNDSVDIVKSIELAKIGEIIEGESNVVFINKEGSSQSLESDSYLTYLNELAKARYALVDKPDVNLMAELLGLGVIPVIAHTERVLDITENVHFICLENFVDIGEEEERKLRDNCIEYYNNKIVSSGVFASLVNHIFVRGF